jgi:hypothetical protein
MTKYTLNNLLGLILNDEEFQQYFHEFQRAQQIRRNQTECSNVSISEIDLIKDNQKWSLDEFLKAEVNSDYLQDVIKYRNKLYDVVQHDHQEKRNNQENANGQSNERFNWYSGYESNQPSTTTNAIPYYEILSFSKECIPLTKYTLESFLDLGLQDEEFEQYFKAFQDAQQICRAKAKRFPWFTSKVDRIKNYQKWSLDDFLKSGVNSNELKSVIEYRKRLNEAVQCDQNAIGAISYGSGFTCRQLCFGCL